MSTEQQSEDQTVLLYDIQLDQKFKIPGDNRVFMYRKIPNEFGTEYIELDRESLKPIVGAARLRLSKLQEVIPQ